MPDSVNSKLCETINDFVVTAQYKDKVILAEATTSAYLTKAVVWNLDYYGNPYNGSYFNNLLSAQHEFATRAFGW